MNLDLEVKIFGLKKLHDFDAVLAGVKNGDRDSMQKAIYHVIDILAEFLPKERGCLIEGEGAVFEAVHLMFELKELFKENKLQIVRGERLLKE